MTQADDGTPRDPAKVERLSAPECWEVLERLEFGRLAYVVEGRIELAPVNYAVHEGELVFRTAEGSVLAGVLRSGEAVFEIDDINEETAISVIVRAHPREFTHAEARWTDQMRLRPWVSSKKELVVGLTPHLISGRRFHLSRTWTTIRPHSR